MKSTEVLLRASAVAALLISAGPLDQLSAYTGCADHCYGTYSGEDSPVYGCISYAGSRGVYWCENYGNYCNTTGSLYCTYC